MRKRRLRRNCLNKIFADQLRTGDVLIVDKHERIIERIEQNERRRLSVWYNGVAHHYNVTETVKVLT